MKYMMVGEAQTATKGGCSVCGAPKGKRREGGLGMGDTCWQCKLKFITRSQWGEDKTEGTTRLGAEAQ